MKPRLNVTEVERLCYSRRKLQAISALRTAGINPMAFGMHKEYRVMGVKGKVYLVRRPDGSERHFTRLVDVCQFARDYQLGKEEPPPVFPKQCVWTDCPYDAREHIDEYAFCQGHAFIYERMLEERKKGSRDVVSFPSFIGHRTLTTPFDIVMEEETPGDDPERAAAIVWPWAEAGVTWWLEAVWKTPETQGGIDGMRARVRQGPPRIEIDR